MKKIALIIISLVLISCSSQPVEEYIDPEDIFDLTEGNEPIWSNEKKKQTQQPQVIYAPYPQGTAITPLPRKEGVLSFEEWKKAKEANSKEYQDYLEYREYLQTLQSQ